MNSAIACVEIFIFLKEINVCYCWFFFFPEARKQVMEATERLGGRYSPSLHPQCTHLVVQISFLIIIAFLKITLNFGTF